MTPAGLLLVLRLLLAVALYAFLAFLLINLWRDLRSASRASGHVPQAYLRVLEGPAVAERYRLVEVNPVGRAADNVICLPEDTVSAHHARIYFASGTWWVEDLGSRNGTTLNETAVQRAMAMRYGDQLRLGKVRLTMESGEPATGGGTAAGAGETPTDGQMEAR